MATNLGRLTKEYYSAWNSHDAEKIASFYTADCVHEDVAIGAVFRGKNELKTGISPLFAAFPDFKLELKSILSATNRLAHEWVMSGTQAGALSGPGALSGLGIPNTGKSFSIRGASITELRDGKISRNTDYWNLTTMLQQLGAMPGSHSQ